MTRHSHREASVPIVRCMPTKRCFWLSVAIAAALTMTFFAAATRSQNNDADIPNNVLAHLNAAINWYKNLTTQAPPGQEPSDTVDQRGGERYTSVPRFPRADLLRRCRRRSVPPSTRSPVPNSSMDIGSGVVAMLAGGKLEPAPKDPILSRGWCSMIGPRERSVRIISL